jgi:4-hydroxy 2-oxovalerate aldolase
MRVVRKMKDAGYKVYVQPVDLMYYNDYELLELISWVNEIEPYAFSMVDTFGSMYVDDIQRIFPLVNHNLSPKVKIGFHSHNNLQLSSAIAQEFVRLSSVTQRDIVVDGTICGMGRGAGNTCTELIAEFLNKKYSADYDMDTLLDLIDIYMPAIQRKCSWGYSIPFLIAGMYNAHVHNISYLLNKHNLDTKNMRQIIEKVDPITRKKYDYDNLEKIYIEHVSKSIDDSAAIDAIRKKLSGKNVVVLSPGKNAKEQLNRIEDYMAKHDAVIISVNFIPSFIQQDIAFFSNYRRIENAKDNVSSFGELSKIITSNVQYDDDNSLKINYNDYIKQGWFHFDNATIMVLRLLIKAGVENIAFAGFDGYEFNKENYSQSTMELKRDIETIKVINSDAKEMLNDIKQHSTAKLTFITDSLYAE